MTTALFTQSAGCRLSSAANPTSHAEWKNRQQTEIATWHKNNRTKNVFFHYLITLN